ncbi:hypothetical protein TW65_01080 [Stemphylium lycopersici]|uniref:Uncharacterized protein n=1 Tax=Stemphylium lycopersici TaxID=183478 RepID=A0A364N7M1_STELY|nr:hypothetical protein TW65_01080 [Stemphylium lycopersici]RAR13294.1 hypothetical protein DDE83_003293 [Stemphylium lycopersici]
MDHTTTSHEPFPALDSAHTTPLHDADATLPQTPLSATTPDDAFSVQYEGPLYTEINIPLPHIPTPAPNSDVSQISSTTTAAAAVAAGATSLVEKARGRSRTLSSLSPFRHRRSSSSSTSSLQSPTSPTSPKSQRHSEDWPNIRREIVRSKEVSAMMDLRHQNKRGRNGTIDALAVVPAVLVLSAELFTPGEEGAEGARKDSGVGRWEEGIR